MYLLRAELHGIGPFDHLELSFADEHDQPRRLIVLHGGGGVGKTSVLAAIGTTRPGHATVQQPRTEQQRLEGGNATAWAAADWWLGQDDPERPHALCVASPNVKLLGNEAQELTRRREQALFDRVATEAADHLSKQSPVGDFAARNVTATNHHRHLFVGFDHRT